MRSWEHTKDEDVGTRMNDEVKYEMSDEMMDDNDTYLHYDDYPVLAWMSNAGLGYD